MSVLGVILARGGSKRLTGKNTKLLGNKPMIEYTINAAIKSGVIDTLIVSTDDESVIDLCHKLGFNYSCDDRGESKVVIDRPDYLATDTAPSEECILHAMDQASYHDHVCLLQPTSPLRTHNHIKSAYMSMIDYKWNGIASYNIQTNKQNGAIWFVEWERLYETRQLVRDCIYYMDAKSSIDVDTICDFNKAESMLTNK